MCTWISDRRDQPVGAGGRRFEDGGSLMKELLESFRADQPSLVWTPIVKRDWTLSSAFEHFGAVRSLRHFGGSAISGDGRTVAVAMWDDEIVRQGNRATYQSRFGPALKGNSKRISLQWIAHIEWAIAHCSGRINVVVLTAEDPLAHPRVIRSCHPDDELVMQITRFDAKTGCFEARST
jgi:hypothetical protein